MSFKFECLRTMTYALLKAPHEHEWTVQGFGFIRAYPWRDKEWRLNVWNEALRVPDVSDIHTHPWSFESIIIAGSFYNTRYLEDGYEYLQRQLLRTGEGGGLVGSPEESWLSPCPTEVYRPGDRYYQGADEIHRTSFQSGAVTLNRRVGDTEKAWVYWPGDEAWVDAIPRPATYQEVEATVNKARALF